MKKWANTNKCLVECLECSNLEYPKQIQKLADCFARYPGIGKKTAERLAFFTFTSLDVSFVKEFSKNLDAVVNDIKTCDVCGNLSETDICTICENTSRDKSTVLVVENVKNLYAIEESNSYNGYYHVLGGVIDPMNGKGPEDINLKQLIHRLKDEEITEVILATNPSFEGESTAKYIKSLLESTDINFSRIAHGIPVGGDIEYTDSVTLKLALDSRTKM